jgi:hypothetical protein
MDDMGLSGESEPVAAVMVRIERQAMGSSPSPVDDQESNTPMSTVT